MQVTFTAKVPSNNGLTFDVDTAEIASFRSAEGTKGGTVIYFSSGEKRIVTYNVETVRNLLLSAGRNPREGFVL